MQVSHGHTLFLGGEMMLQQASNSRVHEHRTLAASMPALDTEKTVCAGTMLNVSLVSIFTNWMGHSTAYMETLNGDID